jgi:hypothetical protein
MRFLSSLFQSALERARPIVIERMNQTLGEANTYAHRFKLFISRSPKDVCRRALYTRILSIGSLCHALFVARSSWSAFLGTPFLAYFS